MEDVEHYHEIFDKPYTKTWKQDLSDFPNFQITEVPKSGEVMIAISTHPSKYKALILKRDVAEAFCALLDEFLVDTAGDS